MSMTVGVYGLGRFGLFWAQFLANHFTVRVYSRTKRDNLPAGIIWAQEAEVCKADALFFCVAISSFESVVERVKNLIAPPTVVFDTCSVKVIPARIMQEKLQTDVRVIACHPMFGPDSAKAGVAGLPLVLSPVRADDETVSFWENFFRDAGIKLIRLSPEEHDREAAFTQGITHYIGRVLADLELKKSAIGTLGYAKLLEIIEQTCNDPWQLFLDIQNYNPYTREMRERLHRSLEKLYAMLHMDSRT